MFLIDIYLCTVSRRLTTAIGYKRPVVNRSGRKSNILILPLFMVAISRVLFGQGKAYRKSTLGDVGGNIRSLIFVPFFLIYAIYYYHTFISDHYNFI